MSLQFSDTTNKGGIIQAIERKLKLGDGWITNDTKNLKDFTARINIAVDRFVALAMKAGGKWQLDDTNHVDYPIITTSIVSGQRDYTFTTDETGNLILDVYKVMVKKTSSGPYEEIDPVDQQSDSSMSSFYDGQNSSGVPTRYDKTGNGIFLDLIPNYNATNGLKVFINREFSRFVSTDTTKMPGFSGLFHYYVVLLPCYEYASENQLPNVNDIRNDIVTMERQIEEHYSARDRDTRKRLTANIESNK